VNCSCSWGFSFAIEYCKALFQILLSLRKKKKRSQVPAQFHQLVKRITSHQENVWKKYPCAMLRKQKACSDIARCTARNTSARWDNRKRRYKTLRKVLSYYHQPKY